MEEKELSSFGEDLWGSYRPEVLVFCAERSLLISTVVSEIEFL
jgi:hypothetical protein